MGLSEDQRAHDLRLASDSWGTEAYAAAVLAAEAPSMLGDRDLVRWYAKVQRHWIAPSAAAALSEHFYGLDVRQVLPTIRVPTLVIAREWENPEEDEFLVGLIPGAHLLRLPGRDWTPWLGDQDAIVHAVHEFAGADQARTEADRALATVLFTDIVDSTGCAVKLGDRRWAEVLGDHHRRVRTLIARYRGREHDTAGDGFFASFDGPARGVRCALEIVEAVKELGIEIRAGAHTGEVETIDHKVGGIAVVTGSRIAAVARPSEVLVSQTVKDLTAGSGLVFEDAGEHELKGVPDRWRLYRVLE